MRFGTTLAVALVLATLGAATAVADEIDFDSYNNGDIFGQDGWIKAQGAGTGYIVIAGEGKYAIFKSSQTDRRDLTEPITSGTVVFSVDTSVNAGTTSLMYTGNDEFFTDSEPTGATGTAACFGVAADKIRYRNGGNWVDGAAVSADTWYTFEGTMDLTTKTYDLSVYLKDTSTLVGSYTNLGFRDPANCDEISRIGILVGTANKKGRYDNISIVPEPTTLGLLVIGGLLAVRRRK